jgi:DNA-binding NarL/FixJ family response regulator
MKSSKVKARFARVFVKLGLRDRPQAVLLAHDGGLVRPHR